MNKDIMDAWKILQEALDILDGNKEVLDDNKLNDPNAGMLVNNDPVVIVYSDVISDGPQWKGDASDDEMIQSILDEINAIFPERSISYDVPDYDPDQVDLETEIIYNKLIERISK